ncbi:hypothetical protein LT974_06755 [Halobacterium noricense]|nr:hypothetical protein [Halobacterium noricense]UHH26628.1 hypothetical protein LT974_06755 [Halobacterium noricense]
MFQTAIDLPGLPAALVVENIGELVEVAFVQLNTAVPTVAEARFASKLGVDLPSGRIVSID